MDIKRKSLNQKRILVFCPWAYSTCYYTAQFCNAAVSDQFKIFLITPENFMNDLLVKEIERINWPYDSPIQTNIFSLLQTPGQLIRFVKIVNELRPDWIHFLWKHHLPVLLKAYIKKFKIAFTVHDPELHSGESGFLRLWVQKKLIDMADIFFVHGENNKKNLIRNFDIEPKKIYNIPHGNIFFWDNVAKMEKKNIILFFGRIKKYKGLDVLLKAFMIAAPQLRGYRLVIRGQGEPGDVPSIINSIPDVDFENKFVPHDKVPGLFADARFVVAPYIDATQSDVISMAFAFGRTVIVSSVGSIPEIVKNGENGLLVSPGNTNELADKMIELANNDDLRLKLEKGALKTSANTNLNYPEKILKIVTKVYCED